MLDVFSEVLRISITAAFVSVIVIIARVFLKRMPRWVTCMLWAVVALRLICPVLPESGLSFIPSFEFESDGSYINAISSENSAIDYTGNSDKSDTEHSAKSSSQIPHNTESVRTQALSVGSCVWCAGAVLMFGYSIYSYVRVKFRFRDAVLYKDNIRQSEKVNSPFVMGLLRPTIYIPFDLDSKTRKQVVLHEQSHIKRLDHIWKPLGFALLSLHWFNPLMWISYIMFCRDVEVACDEKVIKNYGLKMKKVYARALLECRNPSRVFSATPLAFGEIGVGVRIKKTISYKKPSVAAVAFGVAVMLMLSFCLLTDPVSASSQNTVIEQSSVPNTVTEDTVPTEPSNDTKTESFTESSTTPMETTVPQNTESDVDEDYSEEYYYEDESYDNYLDLDYEAIELPLTLTSHIIPPGTYEPIDSFSNRNTSIYGSGIDPREPIYIFEPPV